MDSPQDVAMGHQDTQVHEPFTFEENIEQLNAIDSLIVQLMDHTATALGALTTPSSTSADQQPVELNAETQKEASHAATDKFLATLHSVDVGMKRQILALEEAGIVDLSSAPRQNTGGASRPSLKPNGLGTVGNLDVGWLNSRSTRVERDMEAELWRDACHFLDKNKDKLSIN
ncbi:hypothetical protein CDD82_4760 [Ophiocordyceps australis]|uniref:Mediator of RNA polymerase II transcription subunit 11 n=1 Tax=Ophiocordyceps australis TaxID=1399860 RepID=A0A2C5Z1F6_9HYPO|nr:hypothetical protein CDD82_4760 [Ophiocordyceps australis]